MLMSGAVDAALVPVIEYQQIENLVVVPDVCVGSRRRVRSVVLVTREVELKDVKSVALDVSSRTSAALIKIIFREFLGFEPEWKSSAPDLRRMLEECDAALLIGDPAMTFSRKSLFVYDLAELWREHTGLGFVFAMWMARGEEQAVNALRRVNFAAARDEGLKHVDEIAESYEATLNLPHTELRRYLLENISFDLDTQMRAGLQLYYELAYKHGIISSVRSLKMFGA
jgi:chorismate dehydratase